MHGQYNAYPNVYLSGTHNYN